MSFSGDSTSTGQSMGTVSTYTAASDTIEIETSLYKEYSCSDHYIVISTSSSFAWSDPLFLRAAFTGTDLHPFVTVVSGPGLRSLEL